MSVEEKFYLLVMDEIRIQPGLLDGLPLDLEQHAQTFGGCPLDEALDRLDQLKPLDKDGLGFSAIRTLGEQPTSLTHDVAALRDRLSGDLLADYRALCHEALLNLLWRDFEGTEDRINLAKYLRDEWAFAHFIYGLLRGVDGNVGKAHFELYLAINRETFSCARRRIERALALVR